MDESAKRRLELEENPELEGIYMGKVEGNYEHPDHLFSVGDDEIVVFGTTALNTKMGMVQPKQQVRIKFLGEKKSKQGRVYKDFDVWYKSPIINLKEEKV